VNVPSSAGDQEQEDEAGLEDPKCDTPRWLRLFFFHSSQYSKQTQQVSGGICPKVD
jgi:hypothetical protein